MITDFLTPEEQAVLDKQHRLELGTYKRTFRDNFENQFVVTIDARPLKVLAESAGLASRVYEFMSIRRPGELLHYLYVAYHDMDDEFKNFVENYHGRRRIPTGSEIPFLEIDRMFYFQGDDTTDEARLWLEMRSGQELRNRLDVLLTLTKQLQARLRQRAGFLTQRELEKIDQSKHRLDYHKEINRICDKLPSLPDRTELPEELFATIVRLIKQNDVQSVSCPLQDYALWYELISEQVRRSESTGLPFEEAFRLSSADNGVGQLRRCGWSCKIHLPLEGASGGDLFITPKWWQGFDIEAAQCGESLAAVFNKPGCHYVITQHDVGEVVSANRTAIDEWFMYESKLPYKRAEFD